MTLYRIYNIFEELKNENTKTGKESILKRYKDETNFRVVLEFLYNSYIVTGFSTKKINKDVQMDVNHMVSDIPSIIEYLKENKTGKDYDIRVIRNYLDGLPSDELVEFVEAIVTKSLKIGMTEKSINKAYGANTIPTFAVMLAESYEKKESKVNGIFYITLKLDGNRCLAIKENGEVKFFTRKGQYIEDMNELSEEFKILPDGYAYDGELLLTNPNSLPSDELFRATQKVVRKDGEKKNLQFHIFDMLPVEQFKNGKSNDTYTQRRNRLDILNATHKESFEFINILPVLYMGSDKTQIAKWMAWAENSGFEGLMLNVADGLYLSKRTDGLLKVKTFKTADLLCVSVEEGEGKNVGKVGRINVKYKEDSIVGVGTGLTDENREYYWENPDEIIGKIIEVKFFEESKDEKTQKPSLRFPVFIQIREDKNGEEDVNYE